MKKIDTLYNPDGLKVNEDIKQMKDNILNLTTQEILELQINISFKNIFEANEMRKVEALSPLKKSMSTT